MTYHSLQVFGWLIARDMRVLKTDFVNQVINALIVPITFTIISGYILPYIGLPTDYGVFMLVGTIVFMAYTTTTFRGANQLIADLEGNKAITYELTLPLPPWMVFVKFACTYALNAMFLNILALPVGKLILWNLFDLSQFSFVKFILIYPVMALFFGFYAMWMASWVDGMKGFTQFWLRYGAQLIFFSGYQFSWATINVAIPVFSYINLLNPFVYTFEGMRAAVMGQEGFLSFWVSLVVLLFYCGFFGYLANRNFKKRLDCI